MQPCLSLKMMVSFDWGYPHSVRSLQSHRASLVAVLAARYSALVEESAIVDCFLLAQVTGALQRIKRYPNVDLQSSLFPLQSVSEYPCRIIP